MTTITYSNTLNQIGNKSIIYKINGCEVESSQGDGGFGVIEYLHIKKGNRVVVVDLLLSVNISTCGSTNFDMVECENFRVQTNRHKMTNVIAWLNYAKNEGDGLDAIAHILDQIIKKLKRRTIDSIYVESPDTSIKTMSYMNTDDQYYEDKLIMK